MIFDRYDSQRRVSTVLHKWMATEPTIGTVGRHKKINNYVTGPAVMEIFFFF